jgi:Zn-dependent peptidase ImmA (M78 family)
MSGGSLEVLLTDESDDWSAVTVSDSKSTVVICNPRNSSGRRSSDIAHEMAHLLLRHAPSVLMFAPDGTWALRSYDTTQEEEAAWLSGCLLLPRPALLSIARAGLTPAAAASKYGVSRRMLQARTDMTGVTQQVRNR